MTEVKYRGHEIVVTREKCLGGWPMLYYSIYRISDGYCVEESCEDSAETVGDMVGYMKQRLDAEIDEGNTFEDEEE